MNPSTSGPTVPPREEQRRRLKEEAKLLLRQMLPLLGYKGTVALFEEALTGVVREVWSTGAWTQEQLAEWLGVSRPWLNKLINRRAGSAEPTPLRVDSALFLVLCGAPRPRSHGELVREVSRLLPDAGVDEIRRATLGHLSGWSGRLVHLATSEAGETTYSLQPGAPHVALDAAPGELIEQLKERIPEHLRFHEATRHQNGIGTRVRLLFGANLTRALAVKFREQVRGDVERRIHALEAEARAQREAVLATGAPIPADLDFPFELAIVGSHARLTPLAAGGDS